ncbi:unnamed protein product [Miscanthus lutarioriparius]|uniref:HTH OST-type domain-containing protein n=1 Tax=Miscanthus lutarioriparius TaxID=422564 RepID=A0A811QI96_9POAL|nr:unnamed protein product [Miscanthus lutarioriparius]
MFASRARHLLLSIRPANHGILLCGPTSHASPPGCVVGAQRHYNHHQLQQEDKWEESKAVKVTVWWDFQRCRLPRGASPRHLAPRVTEALRRAGIRGPIEITAFGDVGCIPPAEQEALADTGVALSHVPSSGKDGCDRSFMSDLISWIAQNPPPSHFFLLSGDKDFANILHRLRMSNYNVLLSCPDSGSKMLRSAATYLWEWEDLAKGVDLKPKYLNHPPDGLSSSWYGRCSEPGRDFLLKPKNPMALPRKTKEPNVPKSAVVGIKRVLRFYPQGISVSDLRRELKRIHVNIDASAFGFKNFSALLLAMPDVVKFIDPLPGDRGAGAEAAVVGVFKRSGDSARSSIPEKCHKEGESEETSPCTEKRTLQTEVPSSPSDQPSRDNRKALGFTQRPEPPSKHVEADVTRAGDVPAPPSDAPPVDQRNDVAVDPVMQTERPVSSMEADKVNAVDAPSSSGGQGKPIANGNEALPYFPIEDHVDAYGHSKSVAEQLVLKSNGQPAKSDKSTRLYTCVIRPAAIYGPGEERHLPRILSLAKLGLVFFKIGGPDVKTDWVYIDNLVLALILASMGLLDDIPDRKGTPVAAGSPCNTFEFIVSPLFQSLGYAAPQVTLDTSVALAISKIFLFISTLFYPWLDSKWIPQPLILPAEVYKVGVTHYFSFLKAREELGYVPMVSPREGLAATISYWQERKRRELDGPTIFTRLAVAIGLLAVFSSACLPPIGPLKLVLDIHLFVFRSMLVIRLVFVTAVALHLGEAVYAWFLAKKVDPRNATGWFWQTFALGFFLSVIFTREPESESVLLDSKQTSCRDAFVCHVDVAQRPRRYPDTLEGAGQGSDKRIGHIAGFDSLLLHEHG